jgi:hypothetical protein
VHPPVRRGPVRDRSNDRDDIAPGSSGNPAVLLAAMRQRQMSIIFDAPGSGSGLAPGMEHGLLTKHLTAKHRRVALVSREPWRLKQAYGAPSSGFACDTTAAPADIALAAHQWPPAGRPPVVSVNQFAVAYRGRQGTFQALSDVSLDVPHGEFIKLVGASGKGVGYLNPQPLIRGSTSSLTGGSSPIITRKPEGAGTHPIRDKAETELK